MIDDLEDRIRDHAHAIWEREGRPAGRAEAHWSLAVAEVTEQARPSTARKAKAPAKVAAATAAAPRRRSAAPKADGKPERSGRTTRAAGSD